MKRTLILALVAAAFAQSAGAATQVVCTYKVEAHGTTQAVAGSYALAWQSRKGEWSAADCPSSDACHVTPGGPYTFKKAGSTPQAMPAGDVCAIFRDGAIDKSDPFNVATGVASAGLPLNSERKFTW